MFYKFIFYLTGKLVPKVFTLYGNIMYRVKAWCISHKLNTLVFRLGNRAFPGTLCASPRLIAKDLMDFLIQNQNWLAWLFNSSCQCQLPPGKGLQWKRGRLFLSFFNLLKYIVFNGRTVVLQYGVVLCRASAISTHVPPEPPPSSLSLLPASLVLCRGYRLAPLWHLRVPRGSHCTDCWREGAGGGHGWLWRGEETGPGKVFMVWAGNSAPSKVGLGCKAWVSSH